MVCRQVKMNTSEQVLSFWLSPSKEAGWFPRSLNQGLKCGEEQSQVAEEGLCLGAVLVAHCSIQLSVECSLHGVEIHSCNLRLACLALLPSDSLRRLLCMLCCPIHSRHNPFQTETS